MTGGEAGRRIVILCEGVTEKIAVKEFLTPQWKLHGLARVGLRTIGPVKHNWPKIIAHVEESGNDDSVIAVFLLLDFYGYPGVAHLGGDVRQKVKTVIENLHGRVADCCVRARKKFHPHLSVHEIEAWILAEWKALAKELKISSSKPHPRAEELNLDKPPHNRLHDLFRKAKKGSYRKNKP
ncbi:MAG: DUF4276 family protein, partial [bacterium]